MPFKKGHVPWNKGKDFPKMKGNQHAKGCNPNQTSFVKGHKPWNTGIKGAMSGNSNGMWKGERAGVQSKHDWIKRKFGKAIKCEKCNSIKNVQWSNLDHEYRRREQDWKQLCASCHKKQDYSNGLMGDAGFKKGNFYGR